MPEDNMDWEVSLCEWASEGVRVKESYREREKLNEIILKKRNILCILSFLFYD